MTGSAADGNLTTGEEAGGAELVLPEPVRARIVELAADALAAVPAAEIPPTLRKGATFAPQRRARLGRPAIAAQLASDALFRQQVAANVSRHAGAIVGAQRSVQERTC